LAEVDRELCDKEGGASWPTIITPASTSRAQYGFAAGTVCLTTREKESK